MLSLVPHSVSRARAGFVRNPAAGWSINIPQWIPAPKAPVQVDMARVDRVVDVLTRFVGSWVTQSRKVRRAEVVSKWTRDAMTPNWASIMEREERRERARVRRERERLVMLTDDAWRAYCREQIRINQDVGPLMVAWVPINVERDARAAALAEQERVWQEVARAGLHNRQRAAGVRVPRVVARSGRYAALGDSDSE
jgi:hypothetical protein